MSELAPFIEHTLLKADTTRTHIEKLCQEAIEHHFHGVVVPPFFVSTARQALKEGPPKLVTVVGFPMGYAQIGAKVEEAKKAFGDGADEIDVVMNICALKSGNIKHFKQDIERVATVARLQGKTIKLILEYGLLTEQELEQACQVAEEVPVSLVKTSTGFNEAPGATAEIVRLLRQRLPQHIGIKASGGIGSREQAENLLMAGATRIGTSSSLKIIT